MSDILVPFPQPSGLVAATSLRDYESAAVSYDKNMASLVRQKAVLQPLDSSSYTSDENQSYRAWDEIDRAYRGRSVVAIDGAMTAQAINEVTGLALVERTCAIKITHERNWKIKHRERILDGLTKKSPTGIPRSSTFLEWTEAGNIERYGHHHEISNEKIADPNFGAAAMTDMLADFGAQFNHQLIRIVAEEIAARPHIDRINRASRLNRGAYTQLQRFNDATEFFGRGNMDQNRFTQMIDQEMSRMPRKDVLIVPQENQAALETAVIDMRSFPSKVNDTTLITRQFAEELASLKSVPVGVLRSVGSTDVPRVVVAMPTLHTTSDEPKAYGYNPSRKGLVLASAYEFPRVGYVSRDRLNRYAAQTTVLDMYPGHAQWRLFTFGDAFRRSNGAWMFESALPNAPPSADIELVLEKFRKSLTLSYYENYIQPAKSRDEPTPAVLRDARTVRKVGEVQGFRDALWPFHFDMRPSLGSAVTADHLDETWKFVNAAGAQATKIGDSLRFVRRLGQFREDVLPSQHFHEIAVVILREAQRNARNTDETAAALVPLLANITGIGLDKVTKAAESAADFGEYTWDDAASVGAQLLFLANKVSKKLGLAPKSARPAPAARPRGPQHPAPSKLSSEFLSTIADDTFDAYEHVAALLDQAQENQPSEVRAIVGKFADLAKSYKNDGGVLGAVQGKLLEKLAEMGYSAATPLDEPLRKITRGQLREITTYFIADADIAAVSTPGRAPSFSKAEAHASSDLTGEALGAGLRDYGAVDAAEFDDFPLDYTRFQALSEVLSGKSAVEVWLMMILMSLRFDVPTIQRLDSYGIQLFNASIERVGQQLAVSSCYAMRSQETMELWLTPIRTEVTGQGVVGMTDFTISCGMGVRWATTDAIREMGAVFFNGILGGWGPQLMSSFTEFQRYVSGGARPDEPERVTADCFLNVYPITENRRQYPNNWLGGDVLTEEEILGKQQQVMFHANSGHSMLRAMLGPDTVESLNHMLDEHAAEGWHGFEVDVQAIMHKAANYWPSTDGNRFDVPHPGTGPMGEMAMNNIQVMAAIYDGSGGKFPAAYPESVAPVSM